MNPNIRKVRVRKWAIVVAYWLVAGIPVAQESLHVHADELPWVDGTAILAERFKGVMWQPTPPSAPPLAAPPRFDVGHQRAFFAMDFRTNRQYTVNATLRAVGDFCYIYVADDEWNRRVRQGSVDDLLTVWERETAGNPRQGIYQIESQAFGNPPDIDGDARIVLLLLNIPDNFQAAGSFIAGYFTSINQQKGAVRDPRYGITFQSNETEMIYIDTDPLDVATGQAKGIVAHEMQHLIHYAFDTNEDVWLNEGCSEFAMFLCGYPPSGHVRSFESQPDVSLIQWPSGVGSSTAYYGSVYLWALYLYERYGGVETIRELIQTPGEGIAGVETALKRRGIAGSFLTIFDDWRVAVSVDDRTFQGGRYGFQNERVSIQPRRVTAYPVSGQAGELTDWGAATLEFSASRADLPLQVDVSVPETWKDAFAVRALIFDGSGLTAVRTLTRDVRDPRFSEAFADFGTEISRVVFSVAFQPQSSSNVRAQYQYTARLGTPVSFKVSAFRNPVQPDYLEVVAVPAEPVEAGTVAIQLKRGNKTLSGNLIPSNGGKTFALSFRVPDAQGEWEWELRHFDQLVGDGTVKVAE